MPVHVRLSSTQVYPQPGSDQPPQDPRQSPPPSYLEMTFVISADDDIATGIQGIPVSVRVSQSQGLDAAFNDARNQIAAIGEQLAAAARAAHP